MVIFLYNLYIFCVVSKLKCIDNIEKFHLLFFYIIYTICVISKPKCIDYIENDYLLFFYIIYTFLFGYSLIVSLTQFLLGNPAIVLSRGSVYYKCIL